MPGILPASYNMYTETVDPSNTVSTIVTQENARLNLKTDKINKAYDTKKRQDNLMASETARKNAYYRMFIVVAIVTIVSVGSVYLNMMFPLVPQFILDLFIMIIVSGGIIYLIILYIDIMKRDKVEYDKIDFASLMKPTVKDDKAALTTTTTDSSVVSKNGKDIFNITSLLGDCVGASCCPADSIFVDNKCTKKEGFYGTIEAFSNNQADYMLL
jgi:hypothetical protein